MKAIFALAIVMALTAGCSSSNNDSAAGVSSDDKARWPGEGDYDYSLSYNGCKLEYHAKSQAELCVQLEDQSRDTCGAQGSRQSAFSSQCGGDFEERNLKSVTIDGWDDYLQKRCTVESSSTFPRVSDYCAFLANESQHNGCFWSQRQQEFERYNCPGAFSQQPQKVEPAPRPQPQPTQPSRPTKPSNPYQQMVADYASIGIQVKEAGHSFPPLPGQPTYWQMRDALIPVLEKLLPTFQSQALPVHEITLDDYTAYTDGRLDLYVGMTEPEIGRLLTLEKQVLQLEQRSGLELDFGIVIFGHSKADELANFADKISAISQFEANGSLRSLKPLFDKIEISDKHYATFYDRSLALEEKTFAAQLRADIPLFKKLAAIKSVKFNDFLDMNGDTSGLSSFATWATANQSGLAEVARMNGGVKIEIATRESQTMFGVDLQIGTANFKPTDGLTALLKVAPVMNRLRAEIDISDITMKDDFVKGVALVMSHEATLGKLKLKKITFYSGNSDLIGDELLVGGNDSPQKFEKALAQK